MQNLDFVRAARTDPHFSSDLYGIPLSPAETDDLLRRAAVENSVGPAYSYARGNPSFAGAYFDHLAGGEPVFLFTDPPQGVADELAKRLPAGTSFRIGNAAHTETELLALKDRIDADIEGLWEEGHKVVRVELDTSENRLRVGVLDLTEDTVTRLVSAYSDQIEVFADLPAQADATHAHGSFRGPSRGTWHRSTVELTRYPASGARVLMLLLPRWRAFNCAEKSFDERVEVCKRRRSKSPNEVT